MNIEEKEKSNIIEIYEKVSSSEEQDDSSSESKNIILGYEGDPDQIIEKILIKLFDNINTKIN